MTYSKAKLKNSGDTASPCFKPFLIENLIDTFLQLVHLVGFIIRKEKSVESRSSEDSLDLM